MKRWLGFVFPNVTVFRFAHVPKGWPRLMDAEMWFGTLSAEEAVCRGPDLSVDGWTPRLRKGGRLFLPGCPSRSPFGAEDFSASAESAPLFRGSL